MFDFNSNNLQQGSVIISASGEVVYSVCSTGTPSWETPSNEYLNDGLWVTVFSISGEQPFSQPVQWFNAVIGNNNGMHVHQAQPSDVFVDEDACEYKFVGGQWFYLHNNEPCSDRVLVNKLKLSSSNN